MHQTSYDIFGKDLIDLPVRKDYPDPNGVPEIFEVLRGYFMKNDEEHLKKKGIFRITSTKKDISELAIQLSEGNYSILNEEKYQEPTLVANFLKHILREMKFPIIPLK